MEPLTNRDKAVYPYQPDQKVNWHLEGMKGTGKIVGQATAIAAIPRIGTIWIVEMDSPLKGYPFKCIAVPSSGLEPIEPM